MLDIFFLAGKIILVLISVIFLIKKPLYSETEGSLTFNPGFSLLFVALVMTGIELTTPSDSPWQYVYTYWSFENFLTPFLKGIVFAGFSIIVIGYLTVAIGKLTVNQESKHNEQER